MSSRILGIDIKKNVINGVVVRTGLKMERVESHFQVPMATDGDFEDQLSAAIHQIIAKIDVKDLICQVALPADWIVYRNINIPIKGKSKIRQILPYELEPLLAQPVESFSLDFLPVAIDSTENNNHLITAGVAKEHLKVILDSLAAVKIEPDTVTAGSYALASCLTSIAQVPDQAVLMTVEPETISIYLMVSGQIGMVRTFRVTHDSRTIIMVIDVNLQQTISALEEQYHIEFTPQIIYLNQDLMGVGNELEPKLAKQYDCPVQPVDITRVAELTIQTARSTWHKENINNALSLVLARTRGVKVFDFRRGEYGKKLFLIEQRPRIVKTAILCGVALVLGIVAMVLDGHYSRKALRRVDEQVKAVFTAAFPEVRRIEAPLQQMKVKIREERDKHSEIGAAARNVSVVDILNDISMLIPNRMDVTLTDVTIGPENMSLSGHAANFEMVNDMRTSLERAKWVDTSIISSANQDKTGKRVDFKIRIVFNNVADQNA